MSEVKTSYQLPNLVSLCDDALKLELRVNINCRDATLSSLQWARAQNVIGEDMESVMNKLQFGLLASLCYPTCDFLQLKTAVDFMTWAMFGALEQSATYDDIWTRLKRTTSETWQVDFQQALRAVRDPEPFLGASSTDVSGLLESRRNSSIFMLRFALIEYTNSLRSPSDNRTEDTLRKLARHALEAVIWMDDMASYNLQQAKGDHSNLVIRLGQHLGLSTQAAMSAAAEEVKKALDSFVRLERHVCSSAPQSDPTIREYAQGLQDWITGFAHWIYETDLYFQGNGEEVKTFGWVFVLPKTGINPVETWISEVKESSRSTNNKP